MQTCATHLTDLEELADGQLVCPSCQAEQLIEEMSRGEYPEGDLEKAMFGIPAAPATWKPVEVLKPITIRMSARDIERAKLLAKFQRMPYQTFIKKLLADALDQQEKRFFEPTIGNQ